MLVKEECCYGCAECIHCGRRGKYDYWHECDNCGEAEKTLYHYNGMELCAECIIMELDLSVVEDE